MRLLAPIRSVIRSIILSSSRVRARIGLNSVHSVILLLIRESEKQARRADRPQAGVSEA